MERARAIPSRLGAVVIALASLAIAHAEENPPSDPPRDVGLVERAEARLAQIEFTVLASPEVIAELTADDFRIRLQRREIEEFRLDKACRSLRPESAGEGPSAPPPATRATYLFYFDQPQLTMQGRLRSLELVRSLIPRLIRDGASGMLISNANRLQIIEPLTTDADALLAAVDRIEGDRTQWHLFAHLEETRIHDVVHALNVQADITHAISLARLYQKEESWRAERGMRRLRATLSHLAESGNPRSMIYFADNLRSNPGEHYLRFFGQFHILDNSTLGTMDTDSFSAGATFDELVNAASAQGIRFYTVQAQGLVNSFDRTLLSSSGAAATGAAPPSSRERITDAQDTLSNLAVETGGRAFLNGIGAGKIADRILEDTSCVFVASFDPSDLPKDAALRAIVKTSRKDVELRSRGRIVLPSAKTQLDSRLLRAFASPSAALQSFETQTSVVPIGYDKGRYSALLQFVVPGIPLPNAVWDMGVSVVSGETVHEEDSGRITLSHADAPLVFESEIEFEPGSYEIVSVAHEGSSGLVASDRIEIDWPDPNRQPVTIGPIALMQPASAAFLRSGRSRTVGSMARPRDEALIADLPAALIGLVCRARGARGVYRVEREVVGVAEIRLSPMEFDLRDDRCAQVRDLLPARSLRPGYYRYDVVVLDDKGEMQRSSREFVVNEPGL